MILPSRMTKILVVAGKGDRAKVIAALHDLSAVQLSDAGKAGATEETAQRIYAQLERFRSLEAALGASMSERKFAFGSADDLLGQAAKIAVDDRVFAIQKEIDGLSADKRQCDSNCLALGRMQQFGADISVLNNGHVASFIAQLSRKELDALMEDLKKGGCDAISVPLGDDAIIAVDREKERLFGTTAERHGAKVLPVPRLKGRPEAALREQAEKAEADEKGIKGRMAEKEFLSKEYGAEVGAIREALEIEHERQEAMRRLEGSEHTFRLQGWVRSRDVPMLERELKRVTSGRYVLAKAAGHEKPPTSMDNPRPLNLFERFVTFYSVPQSDELDPTFAFGILFPVFFGAMLGDAGYGAVLLAASLLLLAQLRKGRKRGRLLRAAGTMMSEKALGALLGAMAMSSLFAIAAGVAFDEYFGFRLEYAPLISLEQHMPLLLNIAGYAGVAAVSIGLIMGLANALLSRDYRRAIGRAGWIAVVLPVAYLGVSLLHGGSVSPSSQTLPAYAALGAGALAVAAAEGVNGAMELPSMLSNVLSYMRLAGILLASVILSELIDMLVVDAPHGQALVMIPLAVVFVAAQGLNFLLAVFEASLQGARLIYVEMFSKFYTGNGSPFTPFSAKRVRTSARKG